MTCQYLHQFLHCWYLSSIFAFTVACFICHSLSLKEKKIMLEDRFLKNWTLSVYLINICFCSILNSRLYFLFQCPALSHAISLLVVCTVCLPLFALRLHAFIWCFSLFQLNIVRLCLFSIPLFPHSFLYSFVLWAFQHSAPRGI